jgi:hypothetical protein
VITANDKITINAIAAEAFPEELPAKANSWTRNQLRGLRAMSLIERVGNGLYKSIVPETATHVVAAPAPTALEISVTTDVGAQGQLLHGPVSVES